MSIERGLLDTSVIIALESRRPVDVARFPRQQCVCSISLGELYLGIHVSRSPETRFIRIRTLESLARLTLFDVDGAAAAHWGRLRFRLREMGRRVNVNDLWIAAVALAHDLPVITQDADFEILADIGGPQVIRV